MSPVNDYLARLVSDEEDGSEYTDRWDTGELLCLASAVQRSGDKNWVSVSRSIKPFGDPMRPADWYTPKNCALQYSKLLRGVEDFKKKSLPRTERETSEELLVKNLTDKRITELNWLNQQTRVLVNSLRVQKELLESGEYDEHLDELLKQIEEKEKTDEDYFKDWIGKRETLNATKKLNKCRVTLSKGKAPSRGLDSKRKMSPNCDQIQDASIHTALTDIHIKTEIDTDHELNNKPLNIKQEIDGPACMSALLEGSKTPNIVPQSPLCSTPTSPLLTSLLRSVPSSNAGTPVVSYVNSPLKEPDALGATDIKSAEIDMAALIAKSQETSPRSSASHSPRPTPASSPLLNSLLKSSPGSVSPLTSIQLAQSKEGSSSKTVSSPQSCFNPTSALATAAAQQLAVATSALPQNVFFSQDTVENQKRPIQSSPATSACLSAPTLSKLLEMPPSTPGRLPPLPVVETVSHTAPTIPVNVPEQTVAQSPKKPTAAMLHNELELQITTSSPTKNISDNIISTETAIVDHFLENKVPVPVSPNDKNPIAALNTIVTKSSPLEPKVTFKRPGEIDGTSPANIAMLEDVSQTFKKVFEKKETEQDIIDPEYENQYFNGKSNKETSETLTVKQDHTIEKVIPDDVLNATMNIEKLVSSDMVLDEKVFSSADISDSDLNLFEDEKQKCDMEIDNPSTSNLLASELVTEATDEDKISGRKFYKSRTAKKRPSTEEDSEKSVDDLSTSKPAMKKPNKPGKSDAEVHSQVPINEQLLLAAKEAEEATLRKTPEKSPSKSSEIKSPPAKKPRLYEKASPREKKELSEDETPVVPGPKRPGRKAKKGRKLAKSTPVKQEEPKDQYEFSESTEENSVGYQTANSLCYMPRLKDEDSKGKLLQSQSSEDNSVAASVTLNTEKKHTTPVKTKQGKTSQSAVRKGLFTSDEERMSDSMTSDDASNSHFGEDKLKTWKEYNEKKDAKEDEGMKGTQKATKVSDSIKKKLQQTKRNLFSSKTDTSQKTEKKTLASDMEESSACSRDSEDVTSTTWQREDGETTETKDVSPNVTDDVEAEANDSRMSSSMTVESDKPLDEMEGYESLQGSVTTDFSPLPQSEIKEEKDLTQFGKQDWYQGVSPKSSEPVSQSSEESEYESDNWDSQSVSTNKSATHSAGPSSKSKRKERESPQYKAWKKAISIVLREASCHKYANVFLQKVTNDVAPGYLNIVYRPMDLSLLKKSVDNGVVKTTSEVHRDMLLMFQNAVMYNSSDHDVHHMAVEMQRDVIQQIQAFLTTQLNDKDESNEPTSSLRGARSAKSQKVYGSASKSKEDIHEKE